MTQTPSNSSHHADLLEKLRSREALIGIVGLGYVGLPLAVEFSKYYDVIGFDINKKRIFDLQNGVDKNNEVQKNKIAQNKVLGRIWADLGSPKQSPAH